MKRLDGRVAIVTGAASGIGRATAEVLAAEGAIVVATDIDVAGGEETHGRIIAAGGHARFLAQDVADEDRWADVVAETMAAHGRLDILVNNAGIGTGTLVTEMTLEAWNRQIAINLTGVFLGCKHAVPAMRAGGRGGSIINISSVAGLEGSAGLAGYCATKGGVRLFTKALAKECAMARDGIRVNSVHPGIIDTPIWTRIDQGGLDALAGTFQARAGANALSPDLIAAAGAPLGYAGQPEDIARGILFLASDDSRYMTGSELVIDGGWTA
jgi:NAD(P)-dependent dehydrogenase (short-subunit alcohol dehydrogenase family)